MQIGAKALGANRLDLNCWKGLLGSWGGGFGVKKIAM